MNNIKNGEVRSVRKKYDSLKNWLAYDPIEEGGTVIRVSTKNDEVYDVTIIADGKRSFRKLYEKFKNGGQLDGGAGGGSVSEEDVKNAVDNAVENLFNGESLTDDERKQQQEEDKTDWDKIFNDAVEKAKKESD